MRRMRRVVAVVLGLGLALAAVELGSRFFRLPGRIQVVRAGPTITLLDEGGVVYWEDTSLSGRSKRCAGQPGAVGVFGTSVLAGVGLSDEEVFSARMPRCVDNRARPGFAAETQLAALRHDLPTMGVSRVVWELWSGSVHGYTRVGDAAYSLMGAPAPTGWKAGLIMRSRAAEYLWLTTLQAPLRSRHDPIGNYTRDVLDALPRELSLIVIAPPLHRSFALSRADPHPVDVATRAWAAAHDVRVLDLAEAFADTPVESVRRDTCCHYNAEGHRRIAEMVEASLD